MGKLAFAISIFAVLGKGKIHDALPTKLKNGSYFPTDLAADDGRCWHSERH